MSLNEHIAENTSANYSRTKARKASRSVNESSANGFHNLGIAPLLLKGLERLKFSEPTPIQKAAIPFGIAGDDIIALAQTGSGKTVAFGIPLLQRLAKSTKGIGLILVPTRELAIQVDESLQALARSMTMPSAVLIGGAPMGLQLRALRAKPRVIIATPGRLMDHLERGTIRLSNIEAFILDEADRMLDMGFIPDIKKIIKSIPAQRQTMLFSATMPKEISAIAEKLMTNPKRVEVDRSGVTPADVSQEMFFIQNADRVRMLALQLRECSGPVLVFTRTKRMATKLNTKINKLGFAASEIHSNRSLGQRRHALEGFKRGRFQILIATDIAARGIDVPGIELVVNYDMPANSEDYVHRIGRTGRAGKDGHAISFVNSEQRASLKGLERFLNAKLTITPLPILPTEATLLKEADLQKLRNATLKPVESKGSEKPKERSSRRREYKQDYKKVASRRPGKKRFESNSDDSSGTSPRRKRSRRTVSSTKNPCSTQSSGSNKSNSGADSGSDSKEQKSFWSNFKKKRPAQKKPTGQSTSRRQRSKRKKTK